MSDRPPKHVITYPRAPARGQLMIAVDPDELRALRDEIAALRRDIKTVHMTPRPTWITVPEYAKSIGRSTRTVREWIRGGLIEVKHEGTQVLVRRVSSG